MRTVKQEGWLSEVVIGRSVIASAEKSKLRERSTTRDMVRSSATRPITPIARSNPDGVEIRSLARTVQTFGVACLLCDLRRSCFRVA